MNLSEVLRGVRLRGALPPPLAAAAVAGLAYDSRKVERDFLFFAFSGTRVDGRRFAQDALERGACAVASDLPPPEGSDGPWIEVEHGREALASAARNFLRAPDERVRFLGVTGTNGKTTTTFLVDSILREAGLVTGLMGTTEYRLAGKPSVVKSKPSLGRVFPSIKRVQFSRVFNTVVGVRV